MTSIIDLDRPPRIQPQLPFGEREIPAPPDLQTDRTMRLIQVALPLATIIGYVLLSALGGGSNPWLLIPMALSVVASIAFSIYTYRKEQLERAAAEKAYADRLSKLYQEMHASHDEVRHFYQYNYPDPQITLKIPHETRTALERPSKVQALRAEVRVGERRVTDDDFGVIRLGVGTLPSTVTYMLKNHDSGSNSPHMREAQRLATESQYVSDIPVIITLRPPSLSQADESQASSDEIRGTPISHALAITGERHEVYEFSRAILAHFTVFHASTDTNLYIIASRRQEWSWTAGLPHTQRGDEQSSLIFFAHETSGVPTEHVVDDSEASELDHYLEGIRKTLAQRKMRLQERDKSEDLSNPTLPFLLLVVDLLDAADDDADPLHHLQTDAAISILLEEGSTLGAAVIFLVPRRSKVPGGCHSIIEVERTTPANNSLSDNSAPLYFRYAEIGVNTFRYVGEADTIVDLRQMTDLAQAIGSLTIRQGAGAGLVNIVPFLTLMGYNSLRELEQAAQRRWYESTQASRANWLYARLGLVAGNKAKTLFFSAKRDGNHGVIAGSTGSGKSELLISLIISMAVTYDPTVLNFVLVDYKGGGAFEEFRQLPHCVDLVTNLDGDGVTRMFTAIRAELERRQELNTRTGTRDIVEYRQKGYHLTKEPYPFLFIIIDEFAEMIADRAEFKTQLERITRVGRAQGVSLILAAQRPSGVTDQMRSNIKFRISLRVETTSESREILRRSDAAFLPTSIPGRGYLQVGNEEIELIQVAYAGDPYIDPDQRSRSKVVWLDRQNANNSAMQESAPEVYKVVIKSLSDLAQQEGVPKQLAPWPGFLPSQLSLADPLTSQLMDVPAITWDQYLIETARATFGQPREAVLRLNPFLRHWFDGTGGWIEPLDWGRYAVRPVVGLVDDPYAAKQFPLVVNLPRGHAAVFGASGWGKTTFIRTLLVSLAATHSPSDLHMYILDLGGHNFEVLNHLPHVGAVISPDEAEYEQRVEQLLRELHYILEQRKIMLGGMGGIDQYNQSNSATTLPAIVVAIDNFFEFIATFGKERDNVESVLERFTALARQSRPYGIYFVISIGQLAGLPHQLFSIFTERFALRLTDPGEYREIIGISIADMSNCPGRGYMVVEQKLLSFQVATTIDSQGTSSSQPTREVP